MGILREFFICSLVVAGLAGCGSCGGKEVEPPRNVPNGPRITATATPELLQQWRNLGTAVAPLVPAAQTFAAPNRTSTPKPNRK